MPLSDKQTHLTSDQHKNRIKQQLFWCEDCCKYISDKTRHFQSGNSYTQIPYPEKSTPPTK